MLDEGGSLADTQRVAHGWLRTPSCGAGFVVYCRIVRLRLSGFPGSLQLARLHREMRQRFGCVVVEPPGMAILECSWGRRETKMINK